MFQRSSERMEMVVDIYESAEAFRGHDPDLEGSDMKRDPDTAPHTGGDTAWSRCYRVTAVCVMLLCVLLVTVVTVLWIKHINLNTEYSQLQTSYNNLTIERDQLQRERDILRTFCDLYKRKCFSFSSSLYFMSNEQKSWTESRDDCIKRGADLVIINSREEQDFVVKQLNNLKIWIGLSKRDTKREWKWVDGSPLITKFWGTGEPNNGGGVEDCAEISSHAGRNSWNDNKCSLQLNWICEKHL